MEVVEQECVKVPNAILITGITETEVDEEILDFVKQYGSINRTIPVSDTSPESKKSLIVEFNSGLAVRTLRTMLPYVQQAQDDPEVSFHVTALSDIYVQKLGETTTQTYLNELEALASRSGESFEDVLKGMLVHIHERVVPKPYSEPALAEADDTLPAHSTAPSQTDFTPKQSQVPTNAARHCTVPLASAAAGPESPSLTVSDLNPPAVQKVVVEHLIRTSDFAISGNSPLRLPIHPMKLITKLGAPALNFSSKTQRSLISTEYAESVRVSCPRRRTL